MISKYILSFLLFITPLIAHSETEDLSFVSIDCTQYGDLKVPYIILSYKGFFTKGPLHQIDESKEAIQLLKLILNTEHESWVDPICNGIML